LVACGRRWLESQTCGAFVVQLMICIGPVVASRGHVCLHSIDVNDCLSAGTGCCPVLRKSVSHVRPGVRMGRHSTNEANQVGFGIKVSAERKVGGSFV